MSEPLTPEQMAALRQAMADPSPFGYTQDEWMDAVRGLLATLDARPSGDALRELMVAVELHAVHCDEFDDLHDAMNGLYDLATLDTERAALRSTPAASPPAPAAPQALDVERLRQAWINHLRRPEPHSWTCAPACSGEIAIEYAALALPVTGQSGKEGTE